MLKQLDLEHLIKFYLQTAIKQKDEQVNQHLFDRAVDKYPCSRCAQGLETALEKAAAMKMGQQHAEVAEATKLLAEFRVRSLHNTTLRDSHAARAAHNRRKRRRKAAVFCRDQAKAARQAWRRLAEVRPIAIVRSSEL